MYSVRYCSFWDIVNHASSPAESLLIDVCKFMPNMKRLLRQFQWVRSRRMILEPTEEMKLIMYGMYVLLKDEIIVSVAVIKLNKIDRLLTFPPYRNQGHATRLMNHIADMMIKYKVGHMFSPVEPNVEPLFEKSDWVKVGRTAPDGSHDYCPPSSVEKYQEAVPSGSSSYNYGVWLKYLGLLRQFPSSI